MANVKVLLLGCENFHIPQIEDVEICFEENLVHANGNATYELLLINRNLLDGEINILKTGVKAYCVYYTDTFVPNEANHSFFMQKQAIKLASENVIDFLVKESRKFFSYSYGEKFSIKDISISQSFKGNVNWNGLYSVELEGDYGDDFHQIAFFRYNQPIDVHQALDIWFEYKKSPEVQLEMDVHLYPAESLDGVTRVWSISEAEMSDVYTLYNDEKKGNLFFSIKAQGRGNVEIIALHSRNSHQGKGIFMVGGERFVTSQREEILAYFDPGDMKPPMCVYFSGYKTKEGFEGYRMMKEMGCPFLLIADQRLEGGAFYLGSEEYEKLMAEVIKKYADRLGFGSEDIIMSGISMGAAGAIYYGCDIRPHALVLGKPLASIGLIAENERINRPGGFATALDVLNFHAKDLSEKSRQDLDDRFWYKFRNTDWSATKMIISYMYEDDYDSTAYQKILSELDDTEVHVYGKGLHGRHNDNSAGIVAWFKGQYDKIMKEDFKRS